MTASAILDLIREAGVPGTWSWDRIAIVDNSGPLIPSRQVEGDYSWNRGLNLLLHSEAGVPAYFCKVRPVHHALFRHEMETTHALSSSARLKGIIPETWIASDDTLLLQVSVYLPGQPLGVSLPGLSETAWHEIMGQVLDEAELVSRVAESTLPGYSVGAMVDVAAEAQPALAYLGGVMGDELDVPALQAALASTGQVPGRPQHGDLWPGNVLLAGGQVYLLDFEQFGTVRVPLYDVLHFVRTCWDLRESTEEGATGRPWLVRMRVEEPQARLTRVLLYSRLLNEQLQRSQVQGLVTYYVLDIAYRFHRRGLYYSRLLAEARALSHQLVSEAALGEDFLNLGAD